MKLIRVTPMDGPSTLDFRINWDAVCWLHPSGPAGNESGTWIYFGQTDDPLGVRESIAQLQQLAARR